MILTRGWSLFLVAVGVFNWAIWPRFSVAIWQDQRAWTGSIGHSSPTAFLLVHAVLVITAVVVGTIVGTLGVRGFLADRRIRAGRRPVVAGAVPTAPANG
ncbi:multisubunit Na+/H+ antiporter MnhC subunit [Nakamurella sp. UYEF19]|uniref:SCO4848 family membrane protein n=1 Tax=Nakamurella sp. UYEF19 TaxID=1756392 RepID=UPI0033935E78